MSRVPAIRLTVGAMTLAFVVSGLPIPAANSDAGLSAIKHVIVIMQENRSFDSYFGTYPGANGIATVGGPAKVCVPDKRAGHCDHPYHDVSVKNGGGPHSAKSAIADIDDGRMDGFVDQAEVPQQCVREDRNDPRCRNAGVDVMGYHDRHELPTYWSYADRFVLQDAMFEPNLGWSLPAHLFMVSGWSASCTDPEDAMSCTSNLNQFGHSQTGARDWAWTDLTYLLHKHHVSWGYYVGKGEQPDCADGDMECTAVAQSRTTPSIWNPLPDFTTVHNDKQTANIQDTSRFYLAAKSGTLPSVSWVIPNENNSEHPQALVSTGQRYVASLVNAVMASKDWSSTAIFISWDDWGGFYDHVPPPTIDNNGYGLRVPGLVISPYAKRGFIDHQLLSFDAYNKFIEDVFLNSGRIDPKTDGRPDPRPTVRESVPALGDLRKDFDFSQPPLPGRPSVTNAFAGRPAGRPHTVGRKPGIALKGHPQAAGGLGTHPAPERDAARRRTQSLLLAAALVLLAVAIGVATAFRPLVKRRRSAPR